MSMSKTKLAGIVAHQAFVGGATIASRALKGVFMTASRAFQKKYIELTTPVVEKDAEPLKYIPCQPKVKNRYHDCFGQPLDSRALKSYYNSVEDYPQFSYLYINGSRWEVMNVDMD